MTALTVDSIAAALQADFGVPPDVARRKAEAAIAATVGPSYRGIGGGRRATDATSGEIVERAVSEEQDARLEKAHVAAADKQMRALGYRVINTSQPRHAKFITPGVPDRIYFHRARGVGLFWEAKSATGRQDPAQRDFQEDCDSCGWPYVLGTERELYAWLIAAGHAIRDGSGNLISPPATRPPR